MLIRLFLFAVAICDVNWHVTAEKYILIPARCLFVSDIARQFRVNQIWRRAAPGKKSKGIKIEKK